MLKSLLGLTIGLLASIAIPSISEAYFVAVPANQPALNYEQPVRILVSGRGTNQFTQFRMSALSTAQLLKRNFPGQQIVLISVLEEKFDNVDSFKNLGWKILSSSDAKFDTKTLMPELLKFSKIRALEIFGHNSASLGTQTDGPGFRFDYRDPSVKDLATHFDENAYAFVHGCNSGWIIAQSLSNLWNIPVAGSFTETNFEELNTDGHFYTNDPGKHPETPWAHKNADLGGVPCAAGGCIRMRPATLPYRSDWGDFAGPFVAHYKFFCQLDTRECEKRMAISLYAFLAEKSLNRHSTKNDLREVAKEFLCPSPRDRTVTQTCMKQLDLIDAGHGNPALSFAEKGYKQLVCDLKSCQAKLTCDDAKHTCTPEKRLVDNAHTFADEYLHYINGFDLIRPGDM